MDFLTTIGICLAGIGAIALAVTYAVQRKKVRAYLSAIENPPEIKSPLSVKDALRNVRGVLKNQTFTTKKWEIKEDNPNGMIMAILAFDEDLGTLSSAAKRQMILTVSAITEDDATTVRILYNVYATFGRITSDAILKETTKSIKEAVEKE
ncbi:hypothetical protein BH10CYA1_BH10CYA1_32720 [soil metagenome]